MDKFFYHVDKTWTGKTAFLHMVIHIKKKGEKDKETIEKSCPSCPRLLRNNHKKSGENTYNTKVNEITLRCDKNEKEDS